MSVPHDRAHSPAPRAEAAHSRTGAFGPWQIVRREARATGGCGRGINHLTWSETSRVFLAFAVLLFERPGGGRPWAATVDQTDIRGLGTA